MPTINVRWADNTKDLKRNLKEGVDQIETTKSAVERLVKALAGDNLIAAAHKWTAAISEIGGVSKIASADAVRAFGTITKAIETLERQGKVVPQALRDMAAELKAAIPHATALSTWMGSLGTQLVATAGGFISAQAVIGGVSTAFRTMQGFVEDSVKAYADAEAAQKKLTVAMQTQGTALPATIKQYNDLATQFQQTTAFSDDLINRMEALLVQVGDVMPDSMEAALKASTDLAAGLGIDLETATTLVAKAAAGHTETLGRYGITVDKAALETKGFSAVLEEIESHFGGQAAAQLDTYAGKFEHLKNEWNNLQETAGRLIVTNPILEAGLRLVGDAAHDVDGKTKDTNASLSELATRGRLPGYGQLIAFFENWARSANDTAAALARLKAAQINLVPSHLEQFAPASSHAPAPARFVSGVDVQGLQDGDEALEKIHEVFRDKIQQDLINAAEAAKKVRDALAQIERVGYQDGVAMQIMLQGLEKIGQQDQGVEDLRKHFDELEQSIRRSAAAVKELGQAWPSEIAALSKALGGDVIPVTRQTVSAIGQLAPALNGISQPAKQASFDVSDLAQAFGTLAQISGGSFGGAVQAIGKVIGVINVAETAMKDLQKAVDSGTAKWGDYAKAGVGAFSVLLAGYSALFSYINSANAKDQARFDALHNAQQDFVKRADQFRLELPADEWLALVGKLDKLFKMDPKDLNGIRDLSEEIDALLTKYEKMAGMAGKFGPSHSELVKAAQDAHDVFDFMVNANKVRPGEFSQEQLTAAFLDFQKALAAAGDAAAAAWLKAHGAIEEAASAAQDALNALQSKRDSIASSYANEAPEEVMGSIEAAARAQVAALDQQIVAQQAAIDESAKAAADVITDTVGAAGEETKKKLADGIVDGLSGAGPAAAGAKSEIANVFADFQIAIPFSFYQVGGGPGDFRGGSGGGSEGDNGGYAGDFHGATGGTVRSWGIEPWSMGATLSGPRGADTVPAWLSEGETVRTPQQEAALHASASESSGGDSNVTVQVVLEGHVIGETTVKLVKHNKRGIGTKLKRALADV